MLNLAKNNVFRLILSLAAGYITLRIAQSLSPVFIAGVWSSKSGFVLKVGLGTLFFFFLLEIAVILLAVWSPEKQRFVTNFVVWIRERLGIWRWPVVVLVLLSSVFFQLFTSPGVVFTDPYLRFLISFSVCTLVAVFITHNQSELVQPLGIVFSISLYSSGFILANHLTTITNYPFSLTWSEGNRLYDYSVILGSDRYQYVGTLTLPYESPGRYLLWGTLFAIPNTPIWLHRGWDAILSTLPYILLGYLVARWSQFSTLARISLALWIFLFLYQGPIYAPLIISAIIIVLTVNQKRMWLSLVGVMIAGIYASLSRWTWMPAPAIWAVLILVSGLDFTPGEKWKSFVRPLGSATLVAFVGLTAGVLPNISLFDVQEISSSVVVKQPLLWYRLFPNATYSSGILLGLLLATGPVLAGSVWAVISSWWRINWSQGLVYCIAVMATLIVGLVASVKIGGGSNLHNMDMFLLTLAIIAGLIFKGRKEIPWKTWLIPVQALLFLAIIIPAWSAIREGEPLRLPLVDYVRKRITNIQHQVTVEKTKGEVLFMDQRQLLTFGYIRDVTLVPEYEKKYVMDMAMGNNKEYFEVFYNDLAQKRFALIVSEPLRLVEKGQINSFGEENNAWVTWVSNPILCYYKPIKTWIPIKVQLLIPRWAPVDCPK